jgi:CDP-glucose 4,6-dehydratase
MSPDAADWNGKRVLVTGHTGFKGGWLVLWLQALGARVTGIALPPRGKPNLFDAASIGRDMVDSHMLDLRDANGLAAAVRRADAEIVFHLAAQPLVRQSYRDPLETFGVNTMGTANLLDALRASSSLRAVVAVTTDKVYRNREWCHPYRESDELGGHDPYSASKAASELVVACFRDSFFASRGIALATARAGNVIGGGDWSEERLLPDAVRAWSAGRRLHIRRPDAVRPWQHVLEPLAGYLALAQAIAREPALAGPYNFGPDNDSAATVRHVIELARHAWESGEVEYDATPEGPHEAGTLALDSSRSRQVLGFQPRWNLEQSVRRTCAWYRAALEGQDARRLCEAEIRAWEVAA